MERLPVSLEVGSKKVFATAVDWPGWCRGGRDEAGALGALVEYGERYRAAVGGERADDAGLVLPSGAEELNVVERLPGGSGTDFGAPGVHSLFDDAPVSKADLDRFQLILTGAWEALDRAARNAAGVELTKGPRGGGRDLDKMLGHVNDCEIAYLSRLGSRPPDDDAAQRGGLSPLHQTILDTLIARVRGLPITNPSRAKSLWTPRFYVRYSVWHLLDHAWEIEDRSTPWPAHFEPFHIVLEKKTVRILVTGGAGFIGSHVVDILVAAGHSVAVVDDLRTGRRHNVNPEARLYELDIRSPELGEVFERERPDVVSHHAAQVDVRRSVADPAYDAGVNILGAINVLQAAAAAEVKKVIYISTGGAVYGEPEYLPVDEAHPVVPLSPYGVSKYAAEHYVRVFGNTVGLDWTILRYPNVYGPRQDTEGEAGVVAIFAGRMLSGLECHINGDGNQERDFAYVGDCARANELVLEAGSGRVYNLGTGRGTTIRQLHSALAEITGNNQPPVHGPAMAGETYRIYLDAARAQEEFGWRPEVALEDGLVATVAHLRAERGALTA